MERSIELIDLADKSRTALAGYRGVAQRLKAATESLQLARDFRERGQEWPDTVDSAHNRYESESNCAEDFWQCVREVASAAPLLLSEVASELLHVRLASDRWHTQRDFPWEVAERELRIVEDAARRAAHDMKLGTPSGSKEPPNTITRRKRDTKRSPRTEARDIKWAEEFASGGCSDISEFASAKKVARDTMSKALGRGRAAIEARESVNRSR